MSTPTNPIFQQQSPNPSGSSSHSSGSVGPVIVVLAVITILGVVAGMIGRFCAGRRFSGDSEHDFEGWVERKCSTCIDGRIDIPAPSMPAENGEPKPPETEPPAPT
eukprot:Gb_29050 [translate_table: standard]